MKKFFLKIKKKIFFPTPNFSPKKIVDEKELFKRIKKIELAAKSKLNISLTGSYQTIFRGKGLEFDSVREYQEKDEIRNIDWNVTARTGKLFVKNYTEERELNIYFLVDASASSFFQIKGKTQRELAAEICCCLSLSALQNLDKVGLVLFTDKIEKFLKAKNSKNYTLQIIKELLQHPTQSRHTNMEKALDKFNKLLTSKSIIFLISDFLDQSNYPKILQKIHCKHEIILIDICIFFQNKISKNIFLDVQDMETGQLQTINTYQQNWQKKHNFSRQKLQKFINNTNPLYIKIENYQTPMEELKKFFSLKSNCRKIGQTRSRIIL